MRVLNFDLSANCCQYPPATATALLSEPRATATAPCTNTSLNDGPAPRLASGTFYAHWPTMPRNFSASFRLRNQEPSNYQCPRTARRLLLQTAVTGQASAPISSTGGGKQLIAHTRKPHKLRSPPFLYFSTSPGTLACRRIFFVPPK